MTFIIAIDGGAASGKSSSARRVAEALHLLHVDTGAHYRTLTRWLLDAGKLEAVAQDEATARSLLDGLDLASVVMGREAVMTVNGKLYASDALRSAEVTNVVSRVAAIKVLRERLKRYQRDQAITASAGGFAGLIMEGRDIGSVIFPDAALRIFLEADPSVRAERRSREGILDAVLQRDLADASRQVAPLTCPDGAIRLDSTHLTLEEVVEAIIRLAKQHL